MPDTEGVKNEPKRKIIAYLATSADGYIARPDGKVDWLDRPRPKGNYGMGAFFRSIDTIILGRKTYDFAVAMGGARQFGKTKHYVFSHHPPANSPSDAEFVKTPIPDFAKQLRAQPGKDIMMMGGGGIIASFLDAGEIDEFSIHVIPIFIGEGIPLIEPHHLSVKLQLLATKRFPDGVVNLHYRVLRP